LILKKSKKEYGRDEGETRGKMPGNREAKIGGVTLEEKYVVCN